MRRREDHPVEPPARERGDLLLDRFDLEREVPAEGRVAAADQQVRNSLLLTGLVHCPDDLADSSRRRLRPRNFRVGICAATSA